MGWREVSCFRLRLFEQQLRETSRFAAASRALIDSRDDDSLFARETSIRGELAFLSFLGGKFRLSARESVKMREYRDTRYAMSLSLRSDANDELQLYCRPLSAVDYQINFTKSRTPEHNTLPTRDPGKLSQQQFQVCDQDCTVILLKVPSKWFLATAA